MYVYIQVCSTGKHRQEDGKAAYKFITWPWCSSVNSVITALSVYRHDSSACRCVCACVWARDREREREWEEEGRHADRRAGKRLLNSSFRGLGGSEYKDCMVQRKKGGVAPCRLHMEDWDSLRCDSTKEFACHSPTHPPAHSFIHWPGCHYQGGRSFWVQGEIIQIKANYFI